MLLSFIATPFYQFFNLAPMALQDTEAKITEMLRDILDHQYHSSASNIQLQIIQKQDKTKIMILKVPTDIIDAVKNALVLLRINVNKLYPEYFIYVLRVQEEGLNKAHQINKTHEEWIKDLAFPALVQGRRTLITLDGRVEEAIIERSSDMSEQELKNKEYIFKSMTEKEIRFMLREY